MKYIKQLDCGTTVAIFEGWIQGAIDPQDAYSINEHYKKLKADKTRADRIRRTKNTFKVAGLSKGTLDGDGKRRVTKGWGFKLEQTQSKRS